jgi:hypothetical protein
MNSSITCQPAIRIEPGVSQTGPDSVTVSRLHSDLLRQLANGAEPHDLLKSVFRVTVAQTPQLEIGSVPAVSGRYSLPGDEIRFIPHFPFDRGVKYCASFDPLPLKTFPSAEPLILEFVIPPERAKAAPTGVTNVFPSCVHLPENLLRFYVCFSNSMQRGRALEEIVLFDSAGKPAADSLYRAPVELWDRTMRRLTVLLDPGRLKRWVGPNVELGPPLKAGEKYTLEIGSGMADMHGHPLREPFRKDFIAGEPIRAPVSVDSWRVVPPVAGSHEGLVLTFPVPLDWALLFHTIKVQSTDGPGIDGRILVDQCETRWTFMPTSPWRAGLYFIRVKSDLEDVCGNSLKGAFDRPLRTVLNLARDEDRSVVSFEVQ